MPLPDSLVALMSGGGTPEELASKLYDENLHPPSEPEPPKYELNDSDLQSNTWKKIRAMAHADLITLRIENDNPNLPPIDTATLRGKIQQVKALLALDKTINQQAGSEAPEPDPGY